jgi:A/G-specific adenine glycosylase
MDNFTAIGHWLISWFEENKRDLPWRDTTDPYKIWISEIILQQTRVNQGLDYYYRFIGRFPDVASLAEAKEQEVLKYWQGLGYYSRARNLHKTARIVMEQYGGAFPQDYREVLQLKGVGEYTAAAIVSFAWNKPYPAVDGNVFRVLSRLFASDTPIDTQKGKKYFTDIARMIMPKDRAGDFNQATMEFGALQCVPKSPDCTGCTLNTTCQAYLEGDVNKYPVKTNKTKTKDVYLYYFFIKQNGHTYLKQRTGKGIWENLFEFPSIESETLLDFEDLIKHSSFKSLFQDKHTSYQFNRKIQDKKHVLSHRNLYATLYHVNVEPTFALSDDYIRIKEEDLVRYPVHRLMQYFVEG